MIGIFDSGVGGMTVAKAIEEQLPDQPILYLGDIARSPYGSKSANKISDYAVENTVFLLEKGAKMIVIACNSAASVATERLRQEFSVPILEVISPAVQQALAVSRDGRIGVIGTRATIRSGVYQRCIAAKNPEAKVFPAACPLLVPLVEEGWGNKQETKMILRRYLHPLKNQQIDTLVLGCTHYPLLSHLIQPRIGRRVQLVDSSRATALAVKQYLADHPELLQDASAVKSSYYVTDLTDPLVQMARTIFRRPILLQCI